MKSSSRPSARLRLSRSLSILLSFPVIGLLAFTGAQAIDDIELEIDAIAGPGWTAQGLLAHLELTARGTVGRLQIRSVKLAQLPEPMRNVSIACPDVELSKTQIACRDARIDADMPLLGRQRLLAQVRYERASGALDLQIQGLQVSAGNAALNASLREDRWNIEGTLEALPLEPLMGLLQKFQVELPLASATGATSLKFNATGAGGQVATMSVNGTIDALTANNESGSLATDALGARFEISLSRASDAWRYEARVHADRGQGYAEPIFLDFGAHSFDLTARGKLTDAGEVIAETFRVGHADVMKAEGRIALLLGDAPQVRDANITIQDLVFPGAYDSYMQPLLLDTSVKSLQTQGRLSGAIAIEAGKPLRLDLIVHEFDAEGEQPAVAIRGLSGEWHWDADEGEIEAARASELRWSSGAIYGLDFGEAALRFATAGRDFRLLAPSRIPLLDGALQIDALSVQRAGSAEVGFRVDATIHPISVSRLCRAFGWPEFGGQLSGSLTNLLLEEGVLKLETTLEARVFDGLVTVSDLRLDEPFGNWPRLYANIDLDRLDLDLVTSAFSFGRITGRLSGGIHGLELFNWTPIALDARLYTPPGDRSRRRISQRAVENIGSIGGGGAGVTAALSSGFLRFFEEFNYARLGISCRLQNEVCEMGGVGPAPNGGYYLVQGRGLPRIDVIGNARRVDWPRLVQQLIAATESGGPVVD